MKGFHKIAAMLATIPVASVIALSGGVLLATPAQAAQVCWTAANGSQVCQDDGTGPGSGEGNNNSSGNVSPGSNETGAVPPPPPSPSIQPPSLIPIPNVAPPTRPESPAPVQNNIPVSPVERSIPAPNPLNGSMGNGSDITVPGSEVSEPKKVETEVQKQVETEKVTAEKKVEIKDVEDKKVDPTMVSPLESASSTPSASPTTVMEIDALQSSETKNSAALISTFIVAFATLAGFASFLIIRNFRNRKPALIESDENS